MRLEDDLLILGSAHTSETWTATLEDTSHVATGVTLTAVGSEALVETAVNRVYIVHEGGGTYHWFASLADDFDGYIKFANAGSTIILRSRTEPDDESEIDPDAASWFYADEGDVQDLIGLTALKAISQEPDTSDPATVDHARLQRVGELVDQLIDARMSVLGFETPLAEMDERTEAIMRDISAKMVAWKLNEPRLLLSLSNSRQASSIDKIMQEHRDAAEGLLNRIAYRQIAITATRTYETVAPAAVYIPTTVN